MSDPEPGGRDAAYEWVEIVNISAETVNLAGWLIPTPPPMVIPSMKATTGLG